MRATSPIYNQENYLTEKSSSGTFTLSLPEMSSYRLTKSQLREFMDLITERASSNPLFSMADIVQANNAIQSSLMLNSMYDALHDNKIEGSIDDVQKIINIIIKANTSVNATFKQLAISSDNREEEVDTDPLARMLRELNLENYVPPPLKSHFLKAKNDIKAIEKGEILGENQTEQEKKEMLQDIKTPIKSWVETPVDEKEEEVVDLESEGAKSL